MSIASRTGQVVFSQKSGVYMPALMCNQGDLYQEYEGEATAPSLVVPNYETLKPIISYLITSSRVAEGIVVPAVVKWYFNGTLLAFDSSQNSTNSFNGETGHFKQIPYQSGVSDYFALQIQKNLVKAAGGASCTIKAVATVRVGNVSDDIQCVYTIPVSKGVASAQNVTIIAGDNKYFALRTKNDSCILKAMARSGSDILNTGLSYKWYKMNGGSWEVIAGQTASTLTVTNAMADTTGIFKLEVYKGSSVIGMDTQTVVDLSDPYDILPNPNPSDETITQGSGGKVVYTPWLVKRGDTNKIAGKKFFITFMDSAGVILNPGSGTNGCQKATESAQCTEAMCVQAGGNVNYIIATED